MPFVAYYVSFLVVLLMTFVAVQLKTSTVSVFLTFSWQPLNKTYAKEKTYVTGAGILITALTCSSARGRTAGTSSRSHFSSILPTTQFLFLFTIYILSWVNLYQKFEIEKHTVCDKLILPKKMERHF